jgi:hypothetical protein
MDQSSSKAQRQTVGTVKQDLTEQQRLPHTKKSKLLEAHREMTRRYFLQLGSAGLAGLAASPLWAHGAETNQLLAEAIAQLEYLTPEAKFAGGGRGNPPPYKLTPEQRREAGLDPETWQLEVIADPTSDVKIENPLSKELGNALD